MNAPDNQHLRVIGRPILRKGDARPTTGVGAKAASAAQPGQAE
jgi:hypothetical protein